MRVRPSFAARRFRGSRYNPSPMKVAIRGSLAVLALTLAACGKRGDPRPPVPIIPKATSDLVVTQRGPKVILAWSYPALTTAGKSLTKVKRVMVYRFNAQWNGEVVAEVVSDLHITARQSRKQAWVRELARLEPDLVTIGNLRRSDFERTKRKQRVLAAAD